MYIHHHHYDHHNYHQHHHHRVPTLKDNQWVALQLTAPISSSRTFLAPAALNKLHYSNNSGAATYNDVTLTSAKPQ
jgi:hypothetical protein